MTITTERPSSEGGRRAAYAPGRNADPRAWGVHLISEMAIALALAVVLGPVFTMYVPLQMPQGGSVSLEMLPIIIVAIRRGLVPGVVLGALFGAVQVMLPTAFRVTPVQVLLDYPLAFAALGLSALVPVPRLPAGVASRGSRSFARFGAWLLAAVLVGSLARFVFHFASGIVFFGESAPAGQPVWLYSLIYNVTYLGPEIAITWIALLSLVPALDQSGFGNDARET